MSGISHFKGGLLHFVHATQLIWEKKELRAWYLRRLPKAFVIGLLFLVMSLAIFSFVMWGVFSFASGYFSFDWVAGVLGVFLALLWLAALYFSVGPITLLFMNVYLTQWTDWNELIRLSGLNVPKIKEKPVIRSIPQSFSRALGLSALILLVAPFAWIPFLAPLPVLIGSWALGKDWMWTVDDLFDGQRVRNRTALYCLGLGLVPSALASIPIIGVASLPIIQIASLIRYDQSERRATDEIAH